jgi:tetratricopeptide (TPR) repeat protein
MTMKTLLFAALLVTLASTAHAVEMPKELRGIWCGRAQGYVRCRKADSEDNLYIRARRFWAGEGTACTLLAITLESSGHFLVRAHCTYGEGTSSGPALERWRLFNGGRQLEITAVNANVHGRAGQTPGAGNRWELDFRRCLVRKHFSEGRLVISRDDERMLEIDIEWSDGATFYKLGDVNLSVQIDQLLLPRLQPLNSFGYRLGSFDSVLPALSRGKRLIVSIAGRPERSVELDIGAGKEAAAFLRKCDMYWTNVHIATNAWEKGRASAKVGEYARAIGDFNQAIQKLPKDYTTKRARILFERGQAKLRKADKTGGNADIRAATKLRRWIATMDDINP